MTSQSYECFRPNFSVSTNEELNFLELDVMESAKGLEPTEIAEFITQPSNYSTISSTINEMFNSKNIVTKNFGEKNCNFVPNTKCDAHGKAHDNQNFNPGDCVQSGFFSMIIESLNNSGIQFSSDRNAYNGSSDEDKKSGSNSEKNASHAEYSGEEWNTPPSASKCELTSLGTVSGESGGSSIRSLPFSMSPNFYDHLLKNMYDGKKLLANNLNFLPPHFQIFAYPYCDGCENGGGEGEEGRLTLKRYLREMKDKKDDCNDDGGGKDKGALNFHRVQNCLPKKILENNKSKKLQQGSYEILYRAMLDNIDGIRDSYCLSRHPIVSSLTELPGKMYFMLVMKGTRKPPHVGFPFRSYSDSHYTSVDRNNPIICKVKEWTCPTNSHLVWRLYHYYLGNKKRSSKKRKKLDSFTRDILPIPVQNWLHYYYGSLVSPFLTFAKNNIFFLNTIMDD